VLTLQGEATSPMPQGGRADAAAVDADRLSHASL
jgi:hypothetical protein